MNCTMTRKSTLTLEPSNFLFGRRTTIIVRDTLVYHVTVLDDELTFIIDIGDKLILTSVVVMMMSLQWSFCLFFCHTFSHNEMSSVENICVVNIDFYCQTLTCILNNFIKLTTIRKQCKNH